MFFFKTLLYIIGTLFLFILHKTDMKDKLLKELKKESFPDFSLFLDNKALNEIPELLQELLQERKNYISNFIKKNNEDIKFDDLIHESLLSYLRRILNHLNKTENNPKIRNIISEFRPKIEDFENELSYSEKYYNKILRMYKNIKLNDDQKRILELEIKSYKQRGINLSKEKQSKIKQINKKISKIAENYQRNIIDDQSEFIYYFKDDSTLKELPKIQLEKAKSLWKDWWYGIDAEPSLFLSIEKYCSDPKIRKYFYDKREQRASKWKYDNRKNVLNYIKLSNEKAQILWYKNAWEMYMCNTMAKNPKVAQRFIKKISKSAEVKAKKELEFLKQAFNLKKIEVHDIPYYIRKYKQINYSIDEEKLREYFEFEHVLSRLHTFVKSFFGLELRPINTNSKTQEKWYEVYKDWQLISYYALDAFYRKWKKPGARADCLREKQKWKLPIVFNVCNFQKIKEWPTLLYRKDVEDLFHEFWHAIHAMVSESEYAELSWFNVEWDFVELPSQLMENRVYERESLSKLAKHYQTNEQLPHDILNKLDELKTFMQWYYILRQNEFALVDIHLYTNPAPKTIKELDREIIDIVNQNSIFNRWKEYKMYCSFHHIFWDDYECKYYSYLWADQLWADVFSKIKEKGMFNVFIWWQYMKKILAQWTRKPANELFYDFMWRNVSEDALLKKYWLK